MSVLGNDALLIGEKTSNLDKRLELYPLLAVWPGPAYFTSMSLSFLLCLVLTSEGICEEWTKSHL